MVNMIKIRNNEMQTLVWGVKNFDLYISIDVVRQLKLDIDQYEFIIIRSFSAATCGNMWR